MMHISAHQIISARRSDLGMTLLRHDVDVLIFDGAHPRHGRFTAIIQCMASEVLIGAVILPDGEVSQARVDAVDEIGRSIALIFNARFVGPFGA